MISNPEIIADQKKYIELNKELKELSILVNKGKYDLNERVLRDPFIFFSF